MFQPGYSHHFVYLRAFLLDGTVERLGHGDLDRVDGVGVGGREGAEVVEVVSLKVLLVVVDIPHSVRTVLTHG